MNRFLTGFLVGILTVIIIFFVLPLLKPVCACAPPGRVQRIKSLANMSSLSLAIQEYKIESGHYPSEGTNYVDILLEENIIKSHIRDAWDNPIVFKQTEYTLISMGEDGKLGTIDDILISNK